MMIKSKQEQLREFSRSQHRTPEAQPRALSPTEEFEAYADARQHTQNQTITIDGTSGFELTKRSKSPFSNRNNDLSARLQSTSRAKHTISQINTSYVSQAP